MRIACDINKVAAALIFPGAVPSVPSSLQASKTIPGKRILYDVRIYNCAYVHHTCIGLIFLYMENSADAVITLITCTYMHLLLEQCIFNFQ